jgi:hypothetical protein
LCGAQEAQRLQKWALFEQREAVRLQAKEEKAAAREAAKEERLARKAAERAAKQAALQQKKDLTRKCAVLCCLAVSQLQPPSDRPP